MRLRISLRSILVDKVMYFRIRDISYRDVFIICPIILQSRVIQYHSWLIVWGMTLQHTGGISFMRSSSHFIGLNRCLSLLVVQVVMPWVHDSADNRWLLGSLSMVDAIIMTSLLRALKVWNWLLEFGFLSLEI